MPTSFEIQQQLAQAQKEEAEKLAAVREEVDAILKKHKVFCGGVFNLEGTFEMIKQMVKTGKAVQVPYNLYFIPEPLSPEKVEEFVKKDSVKKESKTNKGG